MRPLPGDDAFPGRSRSASFADSETTPLATRSQPQMSYFIADEKTMESAQSQPSPIPNKPRESRKNSTYGVESLETTISSLTPDNDDQDEKVGQARENWKNSLTHKLAQVNQASRLRSSSPKSSQDASRDVSPSHQRRPSNSNFSRPFTPISLGSHAPPSLLSSPRSRRDSDSESLMDDAESQAIISSGDDDQDVPEMMNSGSAPQLVMPSIKMPSRRPFTERGRNMGRLKIMIAGDSGNFLLTMVLPASNILQALERHH